MGTCVLVGTYRSENADWIRRKKLYNLPLADDADPAVYGKFSSVVLYAEPYPRKADATNDQPTSDRGKNFGRIARSGLMDEYLAKMQLQPVCGIRASYWLEFFKIFHQDATDAQIRGALERLRKKAEAIAESSQKKSFLDVLAALERLDLV